MKRLADKWGTTAKREALTKQLKTLIVEVLMKGGDTCSNLLDNWQICLEKDQEGINSLRAVYSLSGAKRMSKYKKSLVNLASYLFEVESGFASYMNLICLMLVYQGHDLYNFFDRNFAHSIDEIANVNMQTKELFLKEHGFELFNEGYNRRLRNAIAHFDFKIEKDGTVRAKGSKFDVGDEANKLYYFMSLIHEIGSAAATEWQNSIRKLQEKS